MRGKNLTGTDLQEAVDLVARHGSISAAARALNMPRPTFESRYREARRRGIRSALNADHLREEQLQDRIRTLEVELSSVKRDNLDAEYIRKTILGLSETTPDPPKWLIPTHAPKSSVGVPTLFLSDLHWGEVVDETQIGGVNAYDLEIAHRRLRLCVNTAIDLLTRHTVKPEFPGIVLPLGGDMISGDIHEELVATNEMEVMPTVVDLFGALIWVVDTLADKFGRVFVPAVTGNHGRDTKKIRAKGRNFTSFDWLLYVLLERHFAKDKRVTFHVPNGPDAFYRVYSHRYLLTHGDQFRGGDGLIGPIGPIFRGDHKKRSRNAQIAHEYDTLLVGHFHSLMQLERLIVNGSLKGYDEYAFSNNFPYEPPRQALWLTHPDHGITISMPVLLDRRKAERRPWVSWAA